MRGRGLLYGVLVPRFFVQKGALERTASAILSVLDFVGIAGELESGIQASWLPLIRLSWMRAEAGIFGWAHCVRKVVREFRTILLD